MPKTIISDGKIIFKQLLKKQELPLVDIVWAYRQQQDAGAVFGGKKMNLVMNRVVVQNQNGEKAAFPFEKVEDAKQLLNKIAETAPHVAIGYTEENKAKFEV